MSEYISKLLDKAIKRLSYREQEDGSRMCLSCYQNWYACDCEHYSHLKDLLESFGFTNVTVGGYIYGQTHVVAYWEGVRIERTFTW